MSKVVAFVDLTLDGVMQAPGRPDEDRRGGFGHGGWAERYSDPVLGSIARPATDVDPPVQEVIDQAHKGIGRVRRTQHLAYSSLRHAGLSVA